MNELERNLLFGGTTLILATTLVLYLSQYLRDRKNKKDDREQ